MAQAFTGTIYISNGKIRSLEPGPVGVVISAEQGDEHYERYFPTATAFSGFVDSHLHVIRYGELLRGLDLSSAHSAEECVELARLHAEQWLPDDWIVGGNWNHETWHSKSQGGFSFFRRGHSVSALPTVGVLDSVFPTIPVYLTRADIHAAWVNSFALRLAGITAATPDPPGGRIMRDTAGNPTGILLDNAMELVHRLIPPPKEAEVEQQILSACTKLLQYGITEVHDLEVRMEHIHLYQRLSAENKLPLRIMGFVQAQNNEWRKKRILPFGDDMFRAIGVKFFADGALGSRGAWLSEPYTDDSTTSGLCLLSHSELESRVRLALDCGWHIATHAIGDSANRNVLDIYEIMRKEQYTDERTILRIEHTQILEQSDALRMRDIHIHAAVQSIHCISDAPMAEKRLGKRCSIAYPWQRLRSLGIMMSGGSDAPVESPDPRIGIHAFCERIPFAEQHKMFKRSWYPDERISREEALLAYTQHAHHGSGMADRRGVLRVGADADISLFDRNLELCSGADILTAECLATIVGGRFAYQKTH